MAFNIILPEADNTAPKSVNSNDFETGVVYVNADDASIYAVRTNMVDSPTLLLSSRFSLMADDSDPITEVLEYRTGIEIPDCWFPTTRTLSIIIS